MRQKESNTTTLIFSKAGDTEQAGAKDCSTQTSLEAYKTAQTLIARADNKFPGKDKSSVTMKNYESEFKQLKLVQLTTSNY